MISTSTNLRLKGYGLPPIEPECAAAAASAYVCALVSLLTLSPAYAAAKPGTSWAQAELKTVVAAGLMARTAAARPNDPLTKGSSRPSSPG